MQHPCSSVRASDDSRFQHRRGLLMNSSISEVLRSLLSSHKDHVFLQNPLFSKASPVADPIPD